MRFAEVDSTNRISLSAELAGEPSGTVIVAERQTGGVGRRGRTWVSPKGGLYLSIILDGLGDLIDYQKAAIVCGFSALEVMTEYAPDMDFRLKWPNDIYAADKKICGVLVQTTIMGDLSRGAIGIGVNLNIPSAEMPKSIRDRAIFLAGIVGREISIRDFETKLLRRIGKNLKGDPSTAFANMLPAINERLYGKDRIAEIEVAGKKGRFTILRINTDCSLTVFDDENGESNILLAEIL